MNDELSWAAHKGVMAQCDDELDAVVFGKNPKNPSPGFQQAKAARRGIKKQAAKAAMRTVVLIGSHFGAGNDLLKHVFGELVREPPDTNSRTARPHTPGLPRAPSHRTAVAPDVFIRAVPAITARAAL